ncbi:hypothetical protein F5Y15DRAFT_31234 [Xylariaceae sp. FL0016]|nr:hypothetical protein F5Y15DRAFT_31234 [Xylariaceae sp. FL0016]
MKGISFQMLRANAAQSRRLMVAWVVGISYLIAAPPTFKAHAARVKKKKRKLTHQHRTRCRTKPNLKVKGPRPMMPCRVM